MYTRLLAFVVVASVVALPACDDTTVGQPGQSSLPPRLLRVMVQDEDPGGDRGIATDLLNTGSPRACSAIDPCPLDFNINGTSLPDCDIPMGMTTGTCPDPTAAGPVQIGGQGGDVQIRIIFDKILDSSIETVMTGGTGKKTFTLAPGILELDDASGMPVAGAVYYVDNTGSPTMTSDIIANPYGPALVIKPGPLAPSSMYSIKLDPTKVMDQQHHPIVDAKRTPLPTPYTVPFTTEAFKVLKLTPGASAVKPNDVLQIAFNSDVDEKSGMVTLMTADMNPMPVMIEVFMHRGGDPKSCKGNRTPRQLDVVAVSAPGMPADLPEGKYTLTITDVKTKDGKAGVTKTYSITVKGPRGDNKGLTADRNAYDTPGRFVLPEQCMPPDM